MKILAFSDLHLDIAARDAILAAAPEADVIIGAGDFAQRREGLESFMTGLSAIDGKAIYVAGNNETVAELKAATVAPVLHGDAVDRDGITFAGIGCAVPPLPPLPWGSADLTEDEARALLDRIPHADVLISHSPPKGVADTHSRGGQIGSVAVREAAERLQPGLLLCGHVHDCWGVSGMIGVTRVHNLGPAPTWFEVHA
ncbi:MAG: metallophosphoesterase family protein [Roseicyclus sp.]|nr:metallophosphoesterase family protein [Roseicyclus sp.]MBO6625361.1 metallophosphoesterase family protein [Roseicyclus sp.]MBO6922540.1 metallophosphoesterase family protein [Roseicyclus sp.]